MIVALHVATGAAAGAASGSRLRRSSWGQSSISRAIACRTRTSTRVASRSAAVRGRPPPRRAARPLDPATLGAVASSAPDLEHVLPFLRPGGRKLFHDRLGWHRSGRFPAALQLLLAGAILGALIVPRRRAA